ncbi:MAG: rRNA maturation RNase YbeY [Heliobacteriaceae bacterium]|nr:rRNA maturation RNase YbeY [Heliobacteriaceae bacterium]
MELYLVDERETGGWDPALAEEWQMLFERLAYTCLEETGHLTVEPEISLVLTNDEKIRRLNREYRNIDASTDVLSFSQADQTAEEPGYEDPLAGIVLGDVVISVETAERQAVEYGHSLERELGHLFVHGLLHLLGYDHQALADSEQMQATAETILGKCGLRRTDG